jgi:hypothetical protein
VDEADAGSHTAPGATGDRKRPPSPTPPRHPKREKVSAENFKGLKRYIIGEWSWYGRPDGPHPGQQPTITQLREQIERAIHRGMDDGQTESEARETVTEAVSVGVAFCPRARMPHERLLMARSACLLTGLGPPTGQKKDGPRRFPRIVNLTAQMERLDVGGRPRILSKQTYCFERHASAPRGKYTYF